MSSAAPTGSTPNEGVVPTTATAQGSAENRAPASVGVDPDDVFHANTDKNIFEIVSGKYEFIHARLEN